MRKGLHGHLFAGRVLEVVAAVVLVAVLVFDGVAATSRDHGHGTSFPDSDSCGCGCYGRRRCCGRAWMGGSAGLDQMVTAKPHGPPTTGP